MTTLAITATIFIVALSTTADVVLGAAIAGVFSVVNTVIGGYLLREQRRTRRVLETPRRVVYDADGRPLGTLLETDLVEGSAP